jgi:hypothetical protein
MTRFVPHDVRLHIEQLAQQYRFTVNEYSTINIEKIRADLANRTIDTIPVDTEIGYAVALHEIGHMVHPPANSRSAIQKFMLANMPTLENLFVLFGLELAAERAAWAWARAHALVWTTTMIAVEVMATNTYVETHHAWTRALYEHTKEPNDLT